MQKGGWVYIMADRYRGGPYVGVTSDLIRRVHQHREGTGSRHVAEYGKTRLVYAERHQEMEPAIAREKLHDVHGVVQLGPVPAFSGVGLSRSCSGHCREHEDGIIAEPGPWRGFTSRRCAGW